MKVLELRVPPVVVLALALLGGWALSGVGPRLAMPDALRYLLAAGFALLGILMAVSALGRFRRTDTTVNPTTPHKASTLVTDGVYRLTRNPMYLGMLMLQLGYVAWLGTPASLAAIAAFVAWMTVFQIKPEERALQAIFADEYEDFRRRTRRWI